MILLDGQSLRIRDRFPVESMPLNLEERNSTATITVGPEAPTITVGDWVKDETEPGRGIVWRVKTVTNQIDTETRTIQLEHVIQTLKDAVIFGEVKPGTMAGNERAEVCTARQAITYALAQQNIWRLGEMAENPSYPYSFNGDTVFAAVETVTGSLDGAQWEYDLSSLPFTLHLRTAPAAFSSEMRMSRNITTLRKQIDRSRMYTRHYPIGKNNLHLSGTGYVSRNENLYGVICKVETDQSQDTEEKLAAWSTERLKRHCEPLVTVTVSGLELSEATGEALDHIVIGRKCRMPLPEYGTKITEKVTKISWSDKIKEPEKITVTMANLVEDVASIVNQMAGTSGRNARTGAKKAGEDHAWFLDTTTHVGMVAEAVAGPGAAENWSMVSSVIVDGKGIHQRVVKTEEEIVSAWAAIEVLDEKIDIEVANAKSETYAHIEVTASSIRSEVSASKSTIFSSIMQTATNIYVQVANAKSETYSTIEVTASNIRTEISAAKSDTFSTIEQTASTIRSEVNSSKSTIFSTIMQTATNIYTQVGNAKSDTYSAIEQTASSIRTEVNTANSTIFSTIMQTATNIYTQVGNAKSDTYSKIEQTASSIRSEVNTAKSSIYSSIMQTSTEISLKVGKGEVISSINQTAESITINASKINLSGYVQASTLTAQYIANILQNSSVISTTYIYSTSMDMKNFTQDDYSCYVPDAIKALQLTLDGNTYKLQKKHFTSLDWEDVGTFSRAITSWTTGWSNGTFTAKANPQNQSTSTTIYTRFLLASGAYYFDVYRLSGVTPSSVMSLQYKLGFNGNSVEVQNGSGTHTSDMPSLSFQSYINAAAAMTGKGWQNNVTYGRQYKVQNGKGDTILSPIVNGVAIQNKTWTSVKSFTADILVYDENGTDVFKDVGVSFDTTASYDSGRNEVTGSDITLQGYSETSPQDTKPSIAAVWDTVDNKKRVTAYIWLKKSDGKWYRLRAFSFTEP